MVGTERADLLGQVVADERQVDLVDELVAHEGAHHSGPVFGEAQPVTLALQQLVSPLLELAEAGHLAASEAVEAIEKLVEIDPEGPARQPRVLAEQPIDGGSGGGVAGLAADPSPRQEQNGGLLERPLGYGVFSAHTARIAL